MKKIGLLLISILLLTGCSKDTLTINYKEKGEVDFCTLNEKCDFTKSYNKVKVKNFKVDGVNVSIELVKEKDKQSLFINKKEINNINKVRKIFVYNKLVMIDAYYDEINCEGESCRTLLAYKTNGDLIANLNPKNHGGHYTIGGSELLSLFAEYESGKDYYIKDNKLYVTYTSMDEKTYITILGDHIDICDKDKLKANKNIATFVDSEKKLRFVQTVTSVFEFNLKNDYEFEIPKIDYNLAMENAIFKHCVEDSK